MAEIYFDADCALGILKHLEESDPKRFPLELSVILQDSPFTENLMINTLRHLHIHEQVTICELDRTSFELSEECLAFMKDGKEFEEVILCRYILEKGFQTVNISHLQNIPGLQREQLKAVTSTAIRLGWLQLVDPNEKPKVYFHSSEEPCKKPEQSASAAWTVTPQSETVPQPRIRPALVEWKIGMPRSVFEKEFSSQRAILQHVQLTGTLPVGMRLTVDKYCRALCERKGFIKKAIRHILLILPGPFLNSKVYIHGIDPSVQIPTIGIPQAPQMSVPATEKDRLHYGKVWLLQQRFKGSPTPLAQGVKSIFKSDEESESRYKLKLQRKVLPLSDSFALFMVRKDRSDVAAAHIDQKKMGQYHVYIAKNELSALDMLQMTKILNLCYGNCKEKFINKNYFAHCGLATILPYCAPKIRSRLRALIEVKSLRGEDGQVVDEDKPKMLQKLIDFTKKATDLATAATLATLEARLKGDKNLAMFMEERKLSSYIEAFSRLLPNLNIDVEEFLKSCENDETVAQAVAPDEKVIRDFNRSMFTANTLGNSRIFQKFLGLFCLQTYPDTPEASRSVWVSDYIEKLRKYAAYEQGLHAIWKVLYASVKRGTTPLKLSASLVPAPAKVVMTLPDWYEILQMVWDGHYPSTPFPFTRTQIIEAWGGINWPTGEIEVPYHCELQLTDFLISVGIIGGLIGVSKLNCDLCALVLQHRIDKQRHFWRTSGGHSKVYISRLPSDAQEANYTRKMVDKCLMNELKTLAKVSDSPTTSFTHDLELDSDEEVVEVDRRFDLWA